MHQLHRFYARNAAAIWELEGRIDYARGAFRPPAAVQWMATASCDLTCDHCYSHAGPRDPEMLSTQEALALVDELAALGCPQLVIAGGEPLLRRDLPTIVRYAAERGVGWSLHTHGGFVPRHMELFRAVPPLMVAVSIDGPRAIHDAHRGKVGSYDAALHAIRLLRQSLPETKVIIGTTITSRNADHLADMVGDLIESPAHAWGFHLFAPEGRGAAHTELLPSPGQLHRVAALARRLRRRMDVDLDNEWGSAGRLDPFYRDQPFLCGAGRFTCVVAVNGDVMPCTTTDPAAAQGNVRRARLRDIWRTGFGHFRGGEDAPRSCSDGADCWLQTRNGNSCRAHAFGPQPAAPVLPPLAEVEALMQQAPAEARQTPAALTVLPSRKMPLSALRWAAAAALALSLPAPAAARPFPVELDQRAWAEQCHSDFDLFRSEWAQLRSEVEAGEAFTRGERYRRARAVLASDRPLPPRRLIAVLDEVEAEHVWDPWLVGALWSRLGPGSVEETARLLARLEHHARVVDTLILAVADTGPVQYRPWRRKSAPPPGYESWSLQPGLIEAAEQRFAETDAGTWRHEATIALRLTEGSARLHRQGEVEELAAGAGIDFARLDLIELNGTIEIDLPRVRGRGPAARTLVMAGERVLGPRDLAEALDETGAQAVDELVQRALGGEQAAQDGLAGLLPVAWERIGAAVEAEPDKPGAAALRQMLLLWSE